MKNLKIAQILYQIADLLEIQEVEFKPVAYRRAAQSIENLSEPIEEYAKEGKLDDIPGVGKGIASKIEEILKTGSCQELKKLKRVCRFLLMKGLLPAWMFLLIIR